MVRVGLVWDRTVAFVGERQRAWLPIALGMLVLPLAVADVLEPLRGAAAPGPRLMLGGVVLVAALVKLWAQLALTALVLEPADAGGALREGGRRVPAMLGVAVVLLIAFVLVSAPLSYLAITSGASSMDMTGLRVVMTSAARGRIAIGLLLLTLLMLWAAARLCVLMPVVLAERRGLRAIPRAFGLTRGLGLKLVGVVLLYALVQTVVTYATQTVFGAVLMLVAGRGDGGVTAASVVTAAAVAIVSAGFTLLSTVFLAQLYRAVRAAHEGAPAA